MMGARGPKRSGIKERVADLLRKGVDADAIAERVGVKKPYIYVVKREMEADAQPHA